MTNPQSAPTLPERKKSKTPLFIAIGAVAVVGIGAAIVVPQLIGGGDGATTAAGEELTVVKLGTTDASQGHWPVLQELALEEGIDLEIVPFTEYPVPNPALASGEIDINAFQHIDFLADHNLATGDDLQPIGATIIVPLPIYSERWTSVDEIPEGAEIVVPDDSSNQGRALRVLEAADLIELTVGDDVDPTPADIDEAASRVVVTPIAAAQTVAALPTVDGAIINNGFATDAGLDPELAIFSVDPADPASWPYINVIVANADDIDNEAYLKVWELYHSPEVTEIVVEESGGTAVIVDQDGEQVREALAEVEARKAAAAD